MKMLLLPPTANNVPHPVSLEFVHLTDEVKVRVGLPGTIEPALLSRAEVEALADRLGMMLREWEEEQADMERDEEARRWENWRRAIGDPLPQTRPF